MTTENAELELYRIIKTDSNNFLAILFKLICKADCDNRARLLMAFPEFTSVVLRYQNEEGYWESIEERYDKGKSKGC